ncbi:uncharacterized protein F5891DRAFT_93415 [Suillus fuscotomentosus]|uniref:MIF4G domain-containing protein n=1 Tax=Suillus fuscotomentosus TaxID=1912939 RepID=A0AAD4HMM5_9AGAM|nr:uncharacterized protein F5891DRAFT_93415 [Suillus fuscotomentosus]KAG1903255.1 hypothetical protein F5891DRAFT_93415 [Suillus fuscotomentosus]
MWNSWSSQHDSRLEQRKICGLLNKLNVTNFDSVSTKLIERLTDCGRRGCAEIIEAFAVSIALRAVEDTQRSSLYAYLCKRVDRELEMEDRRWTWLNDGTRQLSHPSFASILIEACESRFTQALDEQAPHLFPLIEFIGDLLLDGVLPIADVQDLVQQLFSLAEQGQEGSAIALSRLCRRVAREQEGMHILEQLGASGSIERVLEEDIITPKARYLLMAVVDLFHQELVDVFDSAALRNEIYNLDDDEQEVSSELDSTLTDVDDLPPSKTTTCESEDQVEISKLDAE